MQLPPFHTADEMREISNLVHRIEGTLLGAAAIVALAHAGGLGRSGRWRYLSPAILLGAGLVLLVILLFPTHGLNTAVDQWRFIFATPQQVQHVYLSTLWIAGGTAELLARRTALPRSTWGLGMPLSIVVSGLLFFLHPQHGTGKAVEHALSVHREIGAALITAGGLRLVQAFFGDGDRRVSRLGYAWAFALLVGAVLLTTYHEPAGAYEGPAAHGQ